MSILATAHRRYACKAFDSQFKLSAEQIIGLKTLLTLAPSSINLQARHFIFAKSASAKAKVAAACPNQFAYNASKITDASLTVIFCAPTHIGSETIENVIACEQQHGRFANANAQSARRELMQNYLQDYQQDAAFFANWLDRQLYLALGQVLLGAADLGLDSVAMEGFDGAILSAQFDLGARQLRPVVLAAFGRHSDSDYNATLPKSRLNAAQVFSEF